VKRAGGMAYMIELLPSNCEALSSKPSTVKKKKKRTKETNAQEACCEKPTISCIKRSGHISRMRPRSNVKRSHLVAGKRVVLGKFPQGKNLSPPHGEIQTAINSILEATKMVALHTDRLLGLSRLFFMPKIKTHFFSFSSEVCLLLKSFRAFGMGLDQFKPVLSPGAPQFSK
jgi:hypothetical protein